MKTETMDVSADGFYCIAGEPFAPGSRVRFIIGLPDAKAAGSTSPGSKLYMDGYADVVRVICELQNGYGLGFHITEYHVVDAVNGLGTAFQI